MTDFTQHPDGPRPEHEHEFCGILCLLRDIWNGGAS